MPILLQRIGIINFILIVGSISFLPPVCTKTRIINHTIEKCVNTCRKKALRTLLREKKHLLKQQFIRWDMRQDIYTTAYYSALRNIKVLRRKMLIEKRRLKDEEIDSIVNSVIIVSMKSPLPLYIKQAKNIAAKYYKELRASSYDKQMYILKIIIKNAEEMFHQRINNSCFNICIIRSK